LVLDTLRVSLLALNQSDILTSSVFAVEYSTSKLFEDNCRVVSSANRILNIILEAFGRSLIRIRKSRGPKTDPCGTPVRMSSRVDLTPFITVNCFLFCR